MDVSESLTNREDRVKKTNSLCTYFVVEVEPAEVSGFCCSSVSVSESALLRRFNTAQTNKFNNCELSRGVFVFDKRRFTVTKTDEEQSRC